MAILSQFSPTYSFTWWLCGTYILKGIGWGNLWKINLGMATLNVAYIIWLVFIWSSLVMFPAWIIDISLSADSSQLRGWILSADSSRLPGWILNCICNHCKYCVVQILKSLCKMQSLIVYNLQIVSLYKL